MADDQYERKVKDMQKYIPFLENLIKTLKNNKDDKRVAQLTKMQMLYGLLTNKEKKLKLVTLEKCEAVLMRLHSKVEKTDLLSQGPPVIAEPDDVYAPESPSNSDSFIEFTNPIVIPTERRQSPPSRSSSHHRHSSNSSSYKSSKSSSHSKEFLYDRRDRPRSSHASSSSSSSRNERSPELFRRRSPNHDRPNRYEDELRKKYERPPPLPKYDRVRENPPPPPPPPEDDWDEPRSQKPRHSIKSPAEVLSSPPLSLDDINNLMTESGAQLNRSDPRISRKDHNYGRNRDMPGANLLEQSNRASPKPVEMPVRLAFKYNPHKRRSIEKPITHSRSNDHDQYQAIAPSRTEEIRTINTLPSVNPSDPRLRNRRLSLFMPDNNCPQSPLPHIQSPNSPMPNVHNAMDRMPDNIKSPVYGNQTFYGNFQQQQSAMHMMGHMHSPMFMQHQHPYMPPQPRTYGEYRKARLTDPKPDWPDSIEPTMKNLESPADSTTSSSPSYLDNMYKNADYQQETSPNVFGFKIPKLKNDPPAVNRDEFTKDSHEKPGSWNSADKNRVNTQYSGGFKEQTSESWDNAEENWDNVTSPNQEENWNNVRSTMHSKEKRNNWDNNEENWNNTKPANSSADNEENWDNVNENWDNVKPAKHTQNTEENWNNKKPANNSADNEENWDNVNENWDNVKPAKHTQNTEDKWNNVEENWDNVNSAKNTKNTQNWDNLNKIWNKVKQSKMQSDADDNWDCRNENWSNVKQHNVKSNRNENNVEEEEENWDNVNENCDNVSKKNTENKEKVNWDDLHENWDDDEEEIWDTIAKNDSKLQESSNKHASADPRLKKHKKDRHSEKKKERRSDKKSDKTSKEEIKNSVHENVKHSVKEDRKHEDRMKDVKQKPKDNSGEKDKKKSAERERKKIYKSSEEVKKSDVKKKDKHRDDLKSSAKKKDKHLHNAKKEKSETIKNNVTEEVSSDSTDFTDKDAHPPQTETKKNHGKRKSETKIEKIPTKITKTGNMKSQPKSTETEPELQEKSVEDKPMPVEPIVAEPEAVSIAQVVDELTIDTETSPTTLINSNISSENIIEGRRRTRGSYNRLISPQVSPTKTSPSPKKSKQTYTKKTLDGSQECSVSSTTASVVAKIEKPVEKKKTKKQLAEEQKAQEEAETAKKKAEQEEAGGSKKDEITKEWLEGVLLNLFNPAMMGADQVLGLLQKVLDENKFQQVKNILSPDPEEKPSAVAEPPAIENAVEENEESQKPQPKQSRFRKKTELDRLNEDIRDMFISQGVLTATGRRMCTVINEKHEDQEIPPDAKEDEDGTIAESAVVKAKPKLIRRPRGKRNRRKGVARLWNAGSKARAIKQRKAELEAQKLDQSVDDAEVDAEDDDDDMPLAQAQISSQLSDEEGEELLKIVVGQNTTYSHAEELEQKSVSMLDSSTENVETLDTKPIIALTKIKAEKKLKVVGTKKLNKQPSDSLVEPECYLEDIKKSENDLKSENFDGIDPFADLGEEDEKKAIIKSEIAPKPKRRGNMRGKPGRKLNGEMNKEDAEYKNTNAAMHVQSEFATKCSLCPFAGRYLSNHYVHFHPLAEVLISRLPPATQTRIMLNEGNSAISAVRKPPNKTVYLYACPFCEGQNSFTRKGWIEHFGTHTGEYNFKCSECSRMLNLKMQILKHIEKHCPTAYPIRLRSLLGENRYVFAYICDLCNYVQMTLQKIVNHLRSQHDCSEDLITKITLLDCKPIDSAEPCVRRRKGRNNKDNIKPDPGNLTNTDRNMEVFMAREQNDLNLDTNFMKFMSDISFSATGSPPLQSTMSVADRINERFKNTNTNPYAADSLQDIASDPEAVRQPLMSMADRLSERFSGATRHLPNDDSAKDDSSNESTKEDIAEDHSPAAIVTEESVSETQNKSADDVILLSDGDDDSDASLRIDESVIVKNEKTTSENSESGTECDALANDDDDEWVDIETPPSPSCLDSETKSSNSSEPKSKKNKTIYATLSRLYASIVPKTKKNAEPSSSKNEQNTRDTTVTTPPINKKLDQAVKLRINNLGYSKTSSDALKYKCLVESCTFLYSDIPVGLESHVMFEHPNLEWDGYCHACSNIVATDSNMKLTRELQHMQEVHIDAKPSTSAASSQDTEHKVVPIALKLRRLSGDTLSGAADNECTDVIPKPLSPHPLQISSAVSLNKASAIWQPVNVAKTPDKQPSTLPIVIKQIFSGGAPKSPIVSPRSNLKITKISPPKPGSSTLKITKITGAEAVPFATSTSSGQHQQLKIASVSSAGPIHSFDELAKESETVNLNEIIKLSTLPEKQILKEIKPTKLKPWTLSKSKKSEEIVEKLLQNISLYALFKCMGNECDFVTNDSEKMIEHLGNHSEQQKRLEIETNAFSWLECCYCNIWTGKISKLISHITEKHGHDIYQCPHCYYRSCEEYNIIVHLKLHHADMEQSILVCLGEEPNQANELVLAQQGINRNVKHISCYDCTMVFKNPVEYSKHIETHNPGTSTYKCFHCLPTCNVTGKHLAIKHLTWRHNIACYECVHCSYACEEKLRMNFHMANCHASNSLFCCIRLSMLENLSEEEIHTTIDSDLALILLRKKVDPKYLQFCPYTKLQLNVMEAVVKEPKNPAVYKNPRKLVSNSVIVQKPGGLEIAQVQTITSNVFNKIESPTKTNASGYQSEYESHTKTSAAASSSQSEYESMHTKILAAAKDIVQNTGVNFIELYQCGMPNCLTTLQSAKGFRIHVAQKHPASNETKYSCIHCDKALATVAEYATHYAMHEKHRYFCFLCFHTAPSVSVMVQHVAKIHGIRTKANIVTYPLLKGLLNGKTDFFFVCSTAVKGQEIARFGDRLLKMWERKQWAQMKKSFTPDDVDELPRQAIFFDELYCAICQYRTKVRTNLFRHLQLHKNDVKVANIDPVNPVPCLNAPERHFDKMTNLACSSHTSKSAGTNSPSKIGAGPTNTAGGSSDTVRRVEHILPEFVAYNNRFICGISDCSYLSISELMLKQHLSTLHSSEKNYACPHCGVLICANKLCAEKIIHHLKFHDANLHQCRKCGYLNVHKPVMERHLSEKHPNDNTTYVIYHRTEKSVQKSISESRHVRDKTAQQEKLGQAAESPKSAASSQMKWQCTLCKTRTSTQHQMATHINIAHNIKYRYQCSKCNFGGVLISAITDHANKKHPNKVTEVLCFYITLPEEVDDKSIDTTPLWRRDPNKVKNIRGILMEEESIATPPVAAPSKKITVDLPFPNAEITTTKEPEKEEPDPFANLTAESRMCHICSHIVSSSKDLHDHIFEVHSYKKSESLDKIFKYACYYCKASCDTFVQAVKHWKVVHKNVTMKLPVGALLQGRPFWFRVMHRYMCSLCTKADDYRQIAIHHYLDHPGQVFATRDVTNIAKCGHCSFTFKSNVLELCDHYQAKHLPAGQNEASASEPPIPKPPVANIDLEDLEKFINLGRNERVFKCRSCFMIFLDKTAFDSHNTTHHGIPNIDGFEVLLNTMHYKCPTCNYITQFEQNIIKHIWRKVRSSSMQLEDSTQPIGINESLRPYVLMEIVFPNGFVVERYKISQTQFGSIDVIESTIKDLDEKELSKTASTDGQPGDSDDADSTTSSNRLKRRISMKKSTTKTANIDQFESDDEYKPIVRKKFKSAASLHEPKEDAVNVEPYSYYGTKPSESDLGQVIANVSIDGKDVTIPALDFPNLYKKEIQINLQKINVNDGDEAEPLLPVTESNLEPMDTTVTVKTPTTETNIDEAPGASKK